MKTSQSKKIIQALKQAGNFGITSRDMVNMGIFKYSSRIAELRHDGYHIVATRETGSLFRYNLVERDES